MAKFAFLLSHAPDRYSGLSEDEMMTIFKDYMQWMEEAIAKGTCTGGHKLASEPGRRVVMDNGQIDVHDSPFAEMSEVPGGLMFVNANDYDDAVMIAHGHPHLKHNRYIEIRRIDGDES